MKKTFIAILVLVLFLLSACVNQSEDHPKSTEPESTEQLEWRTDIEGHDLEDWSLGRFRPIYYDLSIAFVDLVDEKEYDQWYYNRTSTEYHNECVAVSFIKRFNINKEDFSRANERMRQIWKEIDHSTEDGSVYELYPVDLIYTFDNNKINEFFLWENSIYAHEVGLPNPNRCKWVDGDWEDYPNWTENPAWREHPFWEYLSFWRE